MNSINLIGRLTRDWERVDTGKMLIKSGLAVDNGKGSTLFIDLVCFNEHTMDAIENYTSKGSMVGISGQLTSNGWTDKNGSKRTSYSVICNKIDFLSDGGNNSAENTPKTPDNSEYVRQDEPKDQKESGDDSILWS